jgi:ABC-2 type transport system ATP-binding protein
MLAYVTVIRLHQVEKRFARVHAVRGVSLEIQTGQVVGVLGPNGAGKTTTIRMIAGLLPPSAGTVSVNSLDSVADSRGLRAQMGYMPESSPLYPEMKVASYLRYRAGLYEIAGRDRRDAVERVLDKCHLSEVRDQRIGTLSKGYRQRVGLASALLHDPPVVILDEPTSGLDPSQVVEARSLIRELSGKRTMLVVSHILPEVERTCDRIVVFARGRVRADGPPGELVSKHSGGRRCVVEVRAESTGNAGVSGVPGPLASVAGVTRAEASATDDGWTRCILSFGGGEADADPRPRVHAACVSAGLALRELRYATASLEEFYIRLIESADAEHAGSGGVS